MKVELSCKGRVEKEKSRKLSYMCIGIPITCPYFLLDPECCPDSLLRHVFRSDSKEQIPLIDERISCLREAGNILCEVTLPVPPSFQSHPRLTDAIEV